MDSISIRDRKEESEQWGITDLLRKQSKKSKRSQERWKEDPMGREKKVFVVQGLEHNLFTVKTWIRFPSEIEKGVAKQAV
jgi:hypothetical protein